VPGIRARRHGDVHRDRGDDASRVDPSNGLVFGVVERTGESFTTCHPPRHDRQAGQLEDVNEMISTSDFVAVRRKDELVWIGRNLPRSFANRNRLLTDAKL
jgi:hypothetical protein